MFSKAEVEKFIEIYEAQQAAEVKLMDFCKQVLPHSSWEVNSASIDGDVVNFSTSWHGAYRPEDHKWFSFPVAMLLEDVAVATDYIQKKQKEEEEAYKRKSEEAYLATRKKLYEEMKKEFGE